MHSEKEKAHEVIKRLFDSLKNRYQNNLELTICSEFVFNYVHLLYYKSHKIKMNRVGSYIVFFFYCKKKKKKATRNQINKKDSKCF